MRIRFKETGWIFRSQTLTKPEGFSDKVVKHLNINKKLEWKVYLYTYQSNFGLHQILYALIID